MKNKNQEIDMVVEEIEKILDIRKLAKLHWEKIPHPQNLIIDEEEVIRVLSVKFEKIANSILTKLKENQVVIAEGIIDYKGTELMGTIGKDFIDVVMNKNNGKKIIILREE